jgi:fatty acid amide hydrolase 2
MPVFPSTAPRHRGTLPHFLEVGTTGIFNALGYPVSIVPMGLDALGLPVGIQIIGKPNRDVVTLEVARMLEETFGGWSPPARLPA